MPRKEALTLDDIAAFAVRPTAQAYAATCREFGVDPAAGIEDPFLAYQLRAALLVPAAEPDDEQIAEDHRSRVAAARESADRLRTWA